MKVKVNFPVAEIPAKAKRVFDKANSGPSGEQREAVALIGETEQIGGLNYYFFLVNRNGKYARFVAVSDGEGANFVDMRSLGKTFFEFDSAPEEE